MMKKEDDATNGKQMKLPSVAIGSKKGSISKILPFIGYGKVLDPSKVSHM